MGSGYRLGAEARPVGVRKGPGTNIETKVRCDDLGAVAERACAAGARGEGRLDQVVTYFGAVGGSWLKLASRRFTRRTAA